MLLNWAILIVMTVVGLAAWYYYKKLTHKDKRQVEAGLPASYGQAMTLAYELGEGKHLSKKELRESLGKGLKKVLGAELGEEGNQALEYALARAEIDYNANAEFRARAFLEMFQHVTKQEKQDLLRKNLLEECLFEETEIKHAMAFTVDLESEFIDPYHVK